MDIDQRGLQYPRAVNPVTERAPEPAAATTSADTDIDTDSADSPSSATSTHKLVKFTPKETHHG